MTVSEVTNHSGDIGLLISISWLISRENVSAIALIGTCNPTKAEQTTDYNYEYGITITFPDLY